MKTADEEWHRGRAEERRAPEFKDAVVGVEFAADEGSDDDAWFREDFGAPRYPLEMRDLIFPWFRHGERVNRMFRRRSN